MNTDTIRLEAETKHWFALLRVTTTGVEAEIWAQRAAGDGFTSKLEGSCRYQAPLHLVRPHVLALINRLAPPPLVIGERLGQ